MADGQHPWFQYYKDRPPDKHPWALSSDTQAWQYEDKLKTALGTYTTTSDNFDHIKIAHLGRRIAVFVARGSQSVVLYDKTNRFPSAKLLASIVLLGS